MNKEQLREILVDKYDYKNSQVDGAIEMICNFSERVSASFEKWLNTGVNDGLEVEGYTAQSIMEQSAKKQRPMNIIAAFMALDWLVKDPAAAKAALNEPVIKNSAAQNH